MMGCHGRVLSSGRYVVDFTSEKSTLAARAKMSLEWLLTRLERRSG